MNIEIKVFNKFNDEVINFLINESYILFSKLRKCENVALDMKNKLKDSLKQMYIKNNKDSDKIYVAYNLDSIVGCAYITEKGYLIDLFLKEDYQNQGIGSSILNKILFDFKDSDIILDSNFLAVDFYKKHNFKIIEQKNNYIKMKK